MGDLVQFSSEQWNPVLETADDFCYIEISSVDTKAGEAISEVTPVKQAPSRARMQVRLGDLLISTTRPHHGAIALVDEKLDGCVASTGFAVARGFNTSIVRPVYMWCILRSHLCLPQMLQRASGGNYPAITSQELSRVLVPTPSLEVQDNIIQELLRRKAMGQNLRKDAVRVWEKAKETFEEKLLGVVS